MNTNPFDEPVDPRIERQNALVWAFDCFTNYQYDRETDLKKIAEHALAHRLVRLANDLNDLIEG